MWSIENSRFYGKYIEKQPKTSQNGLFSAVFWSKWQDSNLRSHRPERCAIPPSLHLEMVKLLDFFVSGQTCGQTEDLMIFRHSGEPKKSVFSRVFGSSRKFYAENGDWVPNDALYQLSHTRIWCFYSFFCCGHLCGQTHFLSDFAIWWRCEMFNVFKGFEGFWESVVWPADTNTRNWRDTTFATPRKILVYARSALLLRCATCYKA